MTATFDFDANSMSLTCHYHYQLCALILRHDPFQSSSGGGPLKCLTLGSLMRALATILPKSLKRFALFDWGVTRTYTVPKIGGTILWHTPSKALGKRRLRPQSEP